MVNFRLLVLVECHDCCVMIGLSLHCLYTMSWCCVFKLRLQCLGPKNHYDSHLRVELFNWKPIVGFPRMWGLQSVCWIGTMWNRSRWLYIGTCMISARQQFINEFFPILSRGVPCWVASWPGGARACSFSDCCSFRQMRVDKQTNKVRVKYTILWLTS